jgi:hypothetical protein
MIGKILGIQHPFFATKTRRVVLVVFLALWAALELYWASMGWAALALSLTALCVYEFFIAFDPANYKRKD